MSSDFIYTTIKDIDVIGKHIFNYGSHIRCNINSKEYHITHNRTEMFIVGGALRDILTGYSNEIKDLDITGKDFCLDMTMKYKSNDELFDVTKNLTGIQSMVDPKNKHRRMATFIYPIDSRFNQDERNLAKYAKMANLGEAIVDELHLDCFEYNNSKFKSYDSTEEMILEFDYTCNMVGLDIINNKLIVHKKFKQFLESKIIELNNDNFLFDDSRIKPDILKRKYTKFKTRSWKFNKELSDIVIANDISLWVEQQNTQLAFPRGVSPRAKLSRQFVPS